MRNERIVKEMFYGASPEIFRRASELRKNMTESEKKLWPVLRKKQIKGMKFRRQHPIRNFIADFYCHELRLVIEVDGEIHEGSDQNERDAGRDYEMKKLGLKVIRFTNSQIDNNIAEVTSKIEKTLIQLLPDRGDGRGAERREVKTPVNKK